LRIIFGRGAFSEIVRTRTIPPSIFDANLAASY